MSSHLLFLLSIKTISCTHSNKSQYLQHSTTNSSVSLTAGPHAAKENGDCMIQQSIDPASAAPQCWLDMLSNTAVRAKDHHRAALNLPLPACLPPLTVSLNWTTTETTESNSADSASLSSQRNASTSAILE